MTTAKPRSLRTMLKSIEAAAMAIASTNPPNWRRPLGAYRNDWVQAIGGVEAARDNHGPSVVYWMGHYYTRRCGSNAKFGAAIWFSRSVGKNEADETQYARLITFSDRGTPAADPLPDYVAQALERSTK